jgi:hypothetical protein
MKKNLTFAIFGLLLISMIGAVSAATYIFGTTYNPELGAIGGANITVACEHGNQTNYQYTSSAESGSEIGDYGVSYSGNGGDVCNIGDWVTVTAIKDDLMGSSTEQVNNNTVGDLDVAIINVPMTPEFGFYMGALTLLSAIGLLVIVRRN